MNNVTHASVTVSIGSKYYELSPLVLEDLEWLETWLKAKAIEAGRASIPANCSEAEETRLMRPIVEASNRISLFDPNGFDQLLTAPGITRIVWCMVRKQHPEVTVELCGQWLMDKSIRKVLMDKVKLAGQFMSDKEASGNDTQESRPSTKRASSKRSSPQGYNRRK